MAFGSFNAQSNNAPMAEINVIPLVDIMLVLLVIFIITAPLLTNAVHVELPRADSAPNLTKPDNIQLSIDAAGQVYWNGEALPRTAVQLRMQEAGARQPAPELHIHADANVRYAAVAETMSDAAKAGLSKIGFVTDPAPPR